MERPPTRIRRRPRSSPAAFTFPPPAQPEEVAARAGIDPELSEAVAEAERERERVDAVARRLIAAAGAEEVGPVPVAEEALGEIAASAVPHADVPRFLERYRALLLRTDARLARALAVAVLRDLSTRHAEFCAAPEAEPLLWRAGSLRSRDPRAFLDGVLTCLERRDTAFVGIPLGIDRLYEHGCARVDLLLFDVASHEVERWSPLGLDPGAEEDGGDGGSGEAVPGRACDVADDEILLDASMRWFFDATFGWRYVAPQRFCPARLGPPNPSNSRGPLGRAAFCFAWSTLHPATRVGRPGMSAKEVTASLVAQFLARPDFVASSALAYADRVLGDAWAERAEWEPSVAGFPSARPVPRIGRAELVEILPFAIPREPERPVLRVPRPSGGRWPDLAGYLDDLARHVPPPLARYVARLRGAVGDVTAERIEGAVVGLVLRRLVLSTLGDSYPATTLLLSLLGPLAWLRLRRG